MSNLIDKILQEFDNPEGIPTRYEDDDIYIAYLPTREFLESSLQSMQEETRREIIQKVKVHFETMVFDDSGEDKMINIMEFRKQQSNYLASLSSPKQEEESYSSHPGSKEKKK